MKIEHIALWTRNIEKMREFYCNYFNGKSNTKYYNVAKKFSSYFISFDNGTRLEIMEMEGVFDNKNSIEEQYLGYNHLAFSVDSRENVDKLTECLRKDGYKVISEPRVTGDGYYESCILDPDGNRIEIVA